MYEKFNFVSVKTIMLAQEEARKLRQEAIGSGFILLGLLSSGGTAGLVLRSVGVDLKSVRAAVEKAVGCSSVPPPIEIPFTPRAKRIIEHAATEAIELGQEHVSTKHLLMALIDEALDNDPQPRGLAAQILKTVGVDLVELRLKTIKANDYLTVEDAPR